MVRERRQWPSLKEAMDFLGVEPPKVPRGADRDELDRLLDEWKAGPLKSAFRKRSMETHPDKGGSAEEFNRVKSAYVEIKKFARLASPVPPPPRSSRFHGAPFFSDGFTRSTPPNCCRTCGTKIARDENGLGSFCYRCGERYVPSMKDLEKELENIRESFRNADTAAGYTADAWRRAFRGRESDD